MDEFLVAFLVHWDNPEGWYEKGGGWRVQNGEHVYTCGRFMQNQYNIVKLKKELKTNKTQHSKN